MRTLKRVIACVLLFCAASTSVPASQSSDPLDDLFRRARPVQAALKTLTASFTETSVSTLLREPVVATGTLVAAMPLRVVMEDKLPTPKTVALDQRWMVIAWANRTDFEKINIAEAQRRVQKYFVDVSPKQLRDSFTVTADLRTVDGGCLSPRPRAKTETDFRGRDAHSDLGRPREPHDDEDGVELRRRGCQDARAS